MKKLSYISAPLWQGAETRGVEKAPQVLIEAGVDVILQQYFDVSHIQIPELTTDIDNNNKYEILAQYLKEVKNIVSTCQQSGTVPLVVGGDHSIGLASVAASAENYDNHGLIWFDAHGDMNTEATSPTGHIHGMPVAAIMGFCKSELNNIPTRHVNPQNIFWIGARSLDEGEQELAKRLYLNIYSTDYIHQVGMQSVMQDIKEKIEAQYIQHLHLSFDVDAFDPTLFPATGVPEQNGLSMNDFNLFSAALPSQPDLIAIDFVEYNPTLDHKDMRYGQFAINLLNTMLFYKFSR